MIGSIKQIGLKGLGRLSTQYDRTTEGSLWLNDWGFNTTERLEQMASGGRTTEG